MTDTTRKAESSAAGKSAASTPLTRGDVDVLPVCARLVDWAQEQDLEVDVLDRNQVVVTLPGERKLRTTVSVRFGEHEAELQAFVIRRPDENLERFYAWLLHKNSNLHGLAFAIDGLGDVYLEAAVPLAAWNDALVDSLMGRFLSAADESFNELLVLGFLTSMKKEWAWRIARGESTRNLAAFEKLLSGEDNEFLGTY
ncbi:YbjN domain-containing protein [Brevibacterium samyangense]|uniref:Sensory transduction regulator n=1 Tax=Brevibacterium samyangense TaxID=366888 RepID=A0ABP5EZ61_9MICO